MNQIFESERLQFRIFNSSDVETLFSIHSEEEVKRWIPNEHYEDKEETLDAIDFFAECVNNNKLPFVVGIILKETRELIGDTGVNFVEGKEDEVEIGYIISQKYAGKGYATEAVKAMSMFVANNFDIKVLYGRVMKGNFVSIRVMEKAGFIFTHEEHGDSDDPYQLGMLVYSLNIDD